MSDSNAQLQWSDEQWNRVRQVVYEEARRARVAGSFLPLYGPLDPSASTVAREVLHAPSPIGHGFTVNDTDTLKLSTLQSKVYLRGAQVADPNLESALIAFRRAANVVARLEDELVFGGQKGPGDGPKSMGQSHKLSPDQCQVLGGQETEGLLNAVPPGISVTGEELVRMVSNAIGTLESRSQLGPFACVLGHDYFVAAQTPAASMVLPQDRIIPLLGGGPLARTSALPDKCGLVIALSGAPIDLVVASDINVGFLQVTLDPWYVFRVYEKIVLRVKQREAIVTLTAPAP